MTLPLQLVEAMPQTAEVERFLESIGPYEESPDASSLPAQDVGKREGETGEREREEEGGEGGGEEEAEEGGGDAPSSDDEVERDHPPPPAKDTPHADGEEDSSSKP